MVQADPKDARANVAAPHMAKAGLKDAESNAAAQQIVQAESKDAEAHVAAPQSVQGDLKDAEPNTKSLLLPYYCSARPKTFQRTADEASARGKMRAFAQLSNSCMSM